VRRRSIKSLFKDQGLPLGMVKILMELRIGKDAGTVSVAVKCVDINWNTEGEGKHLYFS
jgi:hypothetical protein